MIKDLKLDLAIQTAKMDETATETLGNYMVIPAVLVPVHRSTSFIPARRKTKECEIREMTPTGVTGTMGEVTFQMTVDSRIKHGIGVPN